MIQRAIHSTIFIFFFSTQLCAFSLLSKKDYVNTYSTIAVENMIEYKVPASITLAQGILESACGNSPLAKRSNNHFGIKCGKSWNGKKTYHDDDALNECFRVYKNVRESYKDHSLFLVKNTRYAGLFELDPTDYKGWAYGLSKAGYATNPKYARLLIDLIEQLELYTYDVKQEIQHKEIQTYAYTPVNRGVRMINDVKMVVAQAGHTYYKLSKEYGLTLGQIHKYNSTKWNKKQLEEGDIVYLEPKRTRSRKNNYIVLTKNTSPWEVSQQEGVKLKSLLRKNHISSPDEQLRKGEKVFLR